MYRYRVEQNETQRVRLGTDNDLPSSGLTLRAAAIKAGFETLVTVVVETEVVCLDGVHPDRGTFKTTWVKGLSTSGYFKPVPAEYRIVADLRSTDPLERDEEGEVVLDKNRKPKRNLHRKPTGIGIERAELVGGYVGVTAVRAWINK